jgi:hypothetical protein
MHRPATFPNTDFTYNKDTATFASEASDLGGRFTGGSFYIQSVKTKVTKLFLFERAEVDAEGDLVAWHFFVPAGGLRAVVFND